MSAFGAVVGILAFLVISILVVRFIIILIRRMENRKKEKFEKRDY